MLNIDLFKVCTMELTVSTDSHFNKVSFKNVVDVGVLLFPAMKTLSFVEKKLGFQ